MAIEIGEAAINRASIFGADYTLVNRGAAANASGRITSVEIWANANLTDVKVATFYTTNGNTLSTRDSVAIDSVTGGSKQPFAADLEVAEGDYIGMFYTAGYMERDVVGYDDLLYKRGDYIPCSQEAFAPYAGDCISLYGSGVEAAVGGKGWAQK